MSKRFLVAVDDGYAQTKLFGRDAGGNIVRFIMRSTVRPGRFGLVDISGNGNAGAYETEEGEHFTVAEAVESESTQFDGFHTSPLNRVLVNHALVSAGFGGKEVFLVCGLPVDDYFMFDGSKNEKKISTKKANLQKGVKAAKGDLPKLAGIEIGCQAVAAFLDYVLDDEGNERFDTSGEIAVVDVGGRTTDICTIVDGGLVDRQRTGTQKMGVLDVYSAVGNSVRKKFEISDPLSAKVLDRAVRNKKIMLWGEEHDITTEVNEVITEFEGKIGREVNRKLGSAASIKKVLFVGGGGALFENIAEHVRGATLVDDPELANARGLFKFGLLKGWGSED